MGLVQDTATFIKNAWDAVEEMGGDVPAQNKNLANLAAGIASIPQGPLPPGVPTSLEELKQMVNKGQEIVIGTVITDNYNGVDNPLIVVAYLDGTNSAYQDTSGNNITGVILQRSIVTNKRQVWNSPRNNTDYSTSVVNTFLNGTYLSRCSAELQSIISEVKVPVVVKTGATTVNAKVFLPSMEEAYGDPSVSGGPGKGTEGSYFPYWKTKTGSSVPFNDSFGANAGRAIPIDIVEPGTVDTGYWWLRSRDSNSADNSAWTVSPQGRIGGNYTDFTSVGVLPCFVVGKD